VVDRHEVDTDVIYWEEALPVRVTWRSVPLQLIDLASNGLDAVSTLSQELYHDFIKRGTMELMVFGREGFENILPFATFEVCALGGPGDGPVRVIAVDRKGEGLHLLAWDHEEQQLVRRHRVDVTPPDDGTPYHVTSGFALECPAANSAERTFQYKDRRYEVLAQGGIQSLPDPPPGANAAPSP
jgi:hypothetical protein